MNTAQHSNRPWMTKDLFHQEVAGVPLRRKPITMSEIDPLPLMPHREGFGPDRHSDRVPEDPAGPPIMVPPQERDGHSRFDHPADLGEHPEMAPGHHMAVLEPEIEEVTQDVKVLGATIRDVLEKRNDPRQARIVGAGIGRRSQVGVRYEVDRPLHFSLEDGGENGADYQPSFEIGKRAQLSGADGVSSASQCTFDPVSERSAVIERAESLEDGGLKQ
jgi:hypothetical protein